MTNPRTWMRAGFVVGFVAVLATLAAPSLLRTSRADAATPATVSYRYDSVGNLVQDLYPSNNLGYAYDAAKNRQTATIQ